MSEQIYKKYENRVKSPMQLLEVREKMIEEADATIDPYDPMHELAKALHPDYLHLKISEVIEEAENVRSYKLVLSEDDPLDALPFFRAGQYLSFKLQKDGCTFTRPYSIISSPFDASRRGFYKVTLKKVEDGFFTPWAWENWKVGTKVLTSGPSGHFYHTILRDTRDFAALGGGTGIAPFISIARDIVERGRDLHMTIFYGVENEKEIVEREFLDQIEERSQGKVKVVYVFRNPGSGCQGERGFITSEMLDRYLDHEDRSFFICGPKAMLTAMEKIMEARGIRRARVRQEVPGEVRDVRIFSDYPKENFERHFKLTVMEGISESEIEIAGADSLLVSLEKNGYILPSECRCGECGTCRGKLVSGDVFVRSDSDGRRIGDKEFGYVHFCATYPLSDCRLMVTAEKPDVTSL